MTMKIVFAPESSSKYASLVKYVLFYSALVTFGGALLAFGIIYIEDNLGITPPRETGFLTNIFMCFIASFATLKLFFKSMHRLLSKPEYIKIILYSSLLITLLTMAFAWFYMQNSPNALGVEMTGEMLFAMFAFSFISQIVFVWAAFSITMRFFAKKKGIKNAPKIKTAKAKMSSVLAADAKFMIPTKISAAPKRAKSRAKPRKAALPKAKVQTKRAPARKKAG